MFWRLWGETLPDLAGFVALAIWAYLLLGRGAFWRVSRLKAPAAAAPQPPGRVAVVIAARNEADVIGRSIASLLNQSCRESPHIFLVDDSSSDGSGQIARQAACRAGNEASLTVMEAGPVPPGWLGKLWAVHQGIGRARGLRPRFFLLTDADIEHAPDSVSTLVAMAEAGGYDLTSFMVRLECATFAEKALIPALLQLRQQSTQRPSSGRPMASARSSIVL